MAATRMGLLNTRVNEIRWIWLGQQRPTIANHFKLHPQCMIVTRVPTLAFWKMVSAMLRGRRMQP